MKIPALIAEFEGRTELPVDVNDVLACLKNDGHDDSIEFIGVDLDPAVLQGKIKIFYTRPVVYGDPVRNANIYYHRGHDLDWQRFICCKELLHLLDPPSAHTRGQDEIEELSARIGLPREMQNPLADGIQANVDRLAEFRAAAILLPLAARNLLQEPLATGKITLSEIATLADVPRKYAGFAMSPVWDEIHELLKASA